MNLKLEMLETRLALIEARPNAIKSPGVINKIKRKIRNIKKEVGC